VILRIGWIGFHTEGVKALEATIAAGHDIVGVITLRPKRAARRSGAVDYSSICQRLDIPIHFVKHINDTDALDTLRSMTLDLGVVLGWSQILGPETLRTARLGMVGAHASLLPHNRGSAPVNWAIIHGETETGNSLMWLTDGVDEGALIDQRPFKITPYDTCATVYEKVATSNREMVLDLLAKLNVGGRPGKPQPPTDEFILPRRRPADGLIEWQQTAADIYNFIRALTRPYPGAFGWLDGSMHTVWQAAILPMSAELPFSPGTVVGPVRSPEPRACGQLVACGEGSLVVLEVEREDGTVLRGHELSEQNWQGRVWHSPSGEQQKEMGFGYAA
jgi:methionyl-tRNA formyltransferase